MFEALYAFLLKIYAENPVAYAATAVAIMIVEGVGLTLLFEASLRVLRMALRKERAE